MSIENFKLVQKFEENFVPKMDLEDYSILLYF